MGIELRGEFWGDAPAALGIITRQWLGKTTLIDTGFLWIQQTVAEKRLRFSKVLGRDNPANLFTKPLDWQTIRRHSERISVDFADGRASVAPQLHSLTAMYDTNELDHEYEGMFDSSSGCIHMG